METKAKATAKAVNEAQTSAQSEVVIEGIQAKLNACNEVLTMSMTDILKLPPKERVEALNKRKQALETKAQLLPANETSGNFSATGLKGSDILGGLVYNRNIVKDIPANTVELWRKCEKHDILQSGAYIRTWNTSINKYEKNKTTNKAEYNRIVTTLKGNAQIEALKYFYSGEVKDFTKACREANVNKRLPETVPYFDNVNITINGLKGKATENKRFKHFFDGLLNSEGIAGQDINVIVETSEVPQGADVPFNSMNTIYVYNDIVSFENDKSVELFKAWLLFKGATENDLTNEAV